jgi:hypothetical protein
MEYRKNKSFAAMAALLNWIFRFCSMQVCLGDLYFESLMDNNGLFQNNVQENAIQRNESNDPIICIQVDFDCYIQSENGELINYKDFGNQPVPNTVNCRRDVFLSGSLTNSINSSIETSFQIDGGLASDYKVDANNTVALNTYFKEVDLCNIEGITEIQLFDLLLLTSKSDPSSMPNECEKVEKKLYLKLPQVLYPTVSPATISPVEEESFSPSIAESTKQTNRYIWNEVVKIDHDDEECGYAIDVSMNGRDVIVGCPQATIDSKISSGVVHLYRLLTDEGDKINDWKKVNVNLSGENEKDRSGTAVAFAQNRPDIFAVGEPYFDNIQNGVKVGRVRVFRLQNDANTARSLVQKIGGDILGDYFDFLGGTVELSGNGERIAIGATSVITREGYVNLMDFVGGECSVKSRFEGKPNQSQQLGTAISLSEDGEKLGIGAIGDSTESGRAKLFLLNGNSTLVTIDDSQSVETYYDGQSVSVSNDGNVFAVGLPYHDCDTLTKDCGLVQIFNVSEATNPTIQIGSDIMGTGVNDLCGRSLDMSIDGQTIVIGCKGKAIIASLNENEWNIDKTLYSASNSSSFGYAVAISGTKRVVVIGDPGLNSIQVFENQEQKLLSPSSRPSLSPYSKGKKNHKAKGDGKGKKSHKAKGGGKGKKKSKKSKKSKGKKKKCKKSKGKGSKKKKYNKQKKCEEAGDAMMSAASLKQKNHSNSHIYWLPASLIIILTMVGTTYVVYRSSSSNNDPITTSKAMQPKKIDSSINYDKVQNESTQFPIVFNESDCSESSYTHILSETGTWEEASVSTKFTTNTLIGFSV